MEKCSKPPTRWNPHGFFYFHAYPCISAYPRNNFFVDHPIRNVHSPRRPRLNRAIRAVRRTRRIRVSRTAPETCPVCASGRGRCKKGLTKPQKQRKPRIQDCLGFCRQNLGFHFFFRKKDTCIEVQQRRSCT